MRINLAVPEKNVTAPVLEAALEGVTRLNEELIKQGAPTSHQLIADGAKWRPEPPGEEHFDHVGIIQKRGFGDCDDWAPLHAATLRVTGRDPLARAVAQKSGPKSWHAVVERGDGTIVDPSLAAGMPQRGASGVHGAALPLMFPHVSGINGVFDAAMPHVALRAIRDRNGQLESWQSRADLPWHWQPDPRNPSPTDIAMASLHRSPVSSQAMVGACLGAARLGEISGCASPYSTQRLRAIAAGCNGHSWEEIAQAYGPDHADAAAVVVGGFFGSLMKKAKGLARKGLKLLPDVVSFVPGIGPAASIAIKTASPMLAKALKQGKHVKPSHRKALLESKARGGAPVAVPPHAGQGTPFICYPYQK